MNNKLVLSVKPITPNERLRKLENLIGVGENVKKDFLKTKRQLSGNTLRTYNYQYWRGMKDDWALQTVYELRFLYNSGMNIGKFETVGDSGMSFSSTDLEGFNDLLKEINKKVKFLDSLRAELKEEIQSRKRSGSMTKYSVSAREIGNVGGRDNSYARGFGKVDNSKGAKKSWLSDIIGAAVNIFGKLILK